MLFYDRNTVVILQHIDHGLEELSFLVAQCELLFKRFDSRLATFLLEESTIEDCDTLEITHEKIANHMGTAREVVTRMLKYFQEEGMVSLTRGGVTIIDRAKLDAKAG